MKEKCKKCEEHLKKFKKCIEYTWLFCKKDQILHLYKRCKRTGKLLKIEEFYEDKRNKDGLYSYSNNAHSKIVKEYQKKDL